MRLFPKILTVTLSLIAALSLMTITSGSRVRGAAVTPGRSVTIRSSAAIPNATAKSDLAERVMAPGTHAFRSSGSAMTATFTAQYLSDASTFMVTAYLDGIARQERADADAARIAAVKADEAAPKEQPRTADPEARPIAVHTTAPYVGGIHAQPFLICVRRHESDRSDVNGNGLHDGGYAAKNPNSSAAGAYQFLTSTWNSVVNAMGHPEWVGDPRDFSDDIQDQVAWWTYQNQGAGPWSGSGCS